MELDDELIADIKAEITELNCNFHDSKCNVEKKIIGLDTEPAVKRRILENLIQKLEALKITTSSKH